MINSVLIDINHKIRLARPLIEDVCACEIYQTNSVLEVSLSRGQCINDKNGSCIMCDYGIASKNKPFQEYLLEMDRAIKTCKDTVQCLMLCTNGSIFDENQVERELLEGALDLAAKSAISTVQLESHYLDVNSERLCLVRDKLKNKKVIIALGLETANQEYQDLIIGKRINLNVFEDKIALIKSFDFCIELNMMLGLPFLSPREQFMDALNTLRWIHSHQCRPVLFPINIKPYTLLMEMYRADQYSPVSHWLILLLLEQLTEEELSQIILVWHGNRIENYGDPALQQILPTACDKCISIIEDFYVDFATTDSGFERKRILKNVLRKASCSCLYKVKTAIRESKQGFKKRYTSCINFFEATKKEGISHE
ncbi:MAG: hypothetical protein NC124_18760 [Clostridium sp.]|nr:hypothetical protein [Ruminococcus flavefaciens]MCM1500508.1 hypothetical protein [Clostridium sp.]